MASDAALGAAAAGGAGAGFGLLLLWINTYPFIDEGQPARRPRATGLSRYTREVAPQTVVARL